MLGGGGAISADQELLSLERRGCELQDWKRGTQVRRLIAIKECLRINLPGDECVRRVKMARVVGSWRVTANRKLGATETQSSPKTTSLCEQATSASALNGVRLNQKRPQSSCLVQ